MIEWQSRPLDEVYPIVYLDCIVIKVRQDKQVINKAVYLALGVNMEGQKELLVCGSEAEGAKFWLNMLTELQNRGVKDILIACVDGLRAFLTLSILCSLRRKYNSVSSTWCETRSSTSLENLGSDAI